MQHKLETELDRAVREHATGYLTSREFIPFCEFAVARGYGISRVEAIQAPGGKVRRYPDYEILGVDGDENWVAHGDPKRSLNLAREKLAWAKEDGAKFLYQVWIGTP